MNKIAKALHFLGLAMFLGSILGHICVGFVPGAKDRAEAMLFGRQTIEIATWSLTIPGLALLAAMHQTIGALILLNAAFVLVPVGSDLRHLASEIVQGSGSIVAFAALIGRETMFGAANLVLTFVTVFLAVLKPGLGQSRN